MVSRVRAASKLSDEKRTEDKATRFRIPLALFNDSCARPTRILPLQ